MAVKQKLNILGLSCRMKKAISLMNRRIAVMVGSIIKGTKRVGNQHRPTG